MSGQDSKALRSYVQVLDLRAQQAQTQALQAKQAVEQTRSQLQRLQHLAQTSALKNSAGNVALYANAAGFRSGLMEMAQQFRDAYGVQQLQSQQAQQQMQKALLRHESMQCVLEARLKQASAEQARKAQKSMDELAGQAWMRQARASHTETGSR